MKPVLFASARPLERAENLRAVYDAYPGHKQFIQLDEHGHHPEIRSCKYDLMVIDEFPMETPGKTIMIWHAIQGGKYIGLDQPHPYYFRCLAQFMTYIITGGNGTVDTFANCTGVPKHRVLPYGNPRTDVYIGKRKGDGHTILATKRAYLFVPTFRERHETRFPDIDYAWLDNNLTDDEILAVKPHPYRDFLRMDKTYRHIITLPSSEPSAPYLYDADVVITDYSSIMFDGYLLGKPCVLFEKNPGYTQTRGMYLDYPSAYSSRYATNETELLQHLRSATNLTHTEEQCIKHVADMCDGHATERILQLINKLEQDENA